jgi:protein-S-isoprenylcysteine O-methyltransferase Ste14
MDGLESIRYYLALLVLVTWVPVSAFWLLIHPFVAAWRKVGPKVAYAATFGVMVLIGAILFLLRDPLLAVEFGTRPVLWAPAALAYLAALVLEIRCRRQLSFRILVGLPELAPDRSPQELLTQGIYARVRHPRYAAGILALLALAWFTNYLAIYVLFLVFVPVITAVTVLEERELAERFGAEYERYRAKVPRFMPRFR